MSEAKSAESSGGVGGFIRATREEWDKSTFPSSDDVRNTTVIVLISVVFVAVYLYLVDLGWVKLLEGLTYAVNWIAGI